MPTTLSAKWSNFAFRLHQTFCLDVKTWKKLRKGFHPETNTYLGISKKLPKNSSTTGHLLWQTGALIWCSRCLMFCVWSDWSLNLPCCGRYSLRRQQWRRVRKGIHPQTGVRLGHIQKITGEYVRGMEKVSSLTTQDSAGFLSTVTVHEKDSNMHGTSFGRKL